MLRLFIGANSGIGKCIATEIAQKGGVIHMVCRNETTANEAKEEIIEKTGNQVNYFYSSRISCILFRFCI